jgi:hypothetical protein
MSILCGSLLSLTIWNFFHVLQRQPPIIHPRLAHSAHPLSQQATVRNSTIWHMAYSRMRGEHLRIRFLGITDAGILNY